MDRRNFLKAAAAAIGAFALDPERLLWVPGAKTIIDMHHVALPVVGKRMSLDSSGWVYIINDISLADFAEAYRQKDPYIEMNATIRKEYDVATARLRTFDLDYQGNGPIPLWPRRY